MRWFINKYFFVCLLFTIGINSSALNYYWVGGSGNWSDLNHWATTSGGFINHLQVPTPFDDVFFDANSFQAANQFVTVYVGNAVCRDMNWSGVQFNPQFIGSSMLNFRVYGSLTLSAQMNWNFFGNLIMESTTPGKTITTFGKILPFINFQGIGGGWILMDNLTLSGAIVLSAGTFNTNDKEVFCRHLGTGPEPAQKTFILGSSIITCNTVGDGRALYIVNDNLIFDAGTSTFKLIGGSNGNFIKILGNGSPEINFNIIEITNTRPGCLYGAEFTCEISTNTFIHKLVISGADFQLKDPGYNFSSKVTVDSVIIAGICEKSFDSSYNLKIKEIICTENPSFLLNADEQDTVKNISFSGQRCTIKGSNAKFHRVILFGDSFINGNNTFDSLTFAPGFSYELENSKVQTIVNNFDANGLCSANIFLKSSSVGTQANIWDQSGPDALSYMIIRDINAISATPFNAINSVDLGNNTGWTITPTIARDLYWIGGSGNWTDTTHWSTSSGGLGGACIPTPIDNVFFDNYSFSSTFQTVNINTGNALCHNMDWTGASYSPVFTGNTDHNLRIFGSIKLIFGMNWNFNGQTFFEASDFGNTITSAGKSFINNIYFMGSGGWIFLDDFSTSAFFAFVAGSVNTNNKSVFCKTFYSDYENYRELILGTTVFTCSCPARDYNLKIKTNNFILNAGTSTFKLFGQNSNSFPVKIYGSEPLVFYNIENTNLSNCADTAYTCWDVRTALTIHKFTIRDKQFHLLKKGNFNQVKITVDSLLIAGDCDKIFDSVYNLKISDIVCSENATLVLNADQQDTIRNILFNGLHCYIYGDHPKFHHVILNRNSHLFGNIVYDSLSFAPGYLYYLSSGNTQTVNEHFSATGNCLGNIIIKATSMGYQANISKASGIVTVDYVIMQDLNATGGATFNASNSFDLGNNSGWNITTGISSDLFWVGGTGNWNEPEHWALTSGGTGGGCIPSLTNNVIFDQNSFNSSNQRVTINVEHAFCHNMTWTNPFGQPSFFGQPMGNLHIYGSLALSSGMTWAFSGNLFFDATTPGKAISSAGKTYLNDVYFQGSNSGSWIFSDTFTTSGTLFLNCGSLNTNNQFVYCKAFNSDNSNTRALNLGTSTLTCNTGLSNLENLSLNSDNLILNAESSTILLQGNNVLDHAILLKGSAPLIFHDINIRNTGSDITFVDFRTKITIRRLNIKAYQCILGSKNVAANNKFCIDTLIVTSNFGNGYFYLDAFNQYTQRCQMRIHNIISNQNTNLILYTDPFDTINNILSNGTNCTLIGNGTKFRKVTLNGDGWLYGPNTFDTLTFAPGRYYTLQTNTTQVINNLFSALGNGCFPITIRSSQDGVQSTISKSSGNVVCGYVEMKDQKATGGATFYAGKYSSNVSNNTGWIFQDGPGYVYGLGNDTSFCQGDTLLIMTEHFYGGISWLWQDGSTNSSYKVTQPGTYWVKVTYSNTCFYSDTIQVTMRSRPNATASGNSPLCEGNNLYLQGEGGSAYSWTGPAGFVSNVQNPVILNTIPAQSGNYILSTYENGCYSLPVSVPVSIFPVTMVTVSADVSDNPACEGQPVTFTATPSGGGANPSYLWYVNSVVVANGPDFSYMPANGDQIQVVLTSDLLCKTGSPASSNIITMDVSPLVPAGIDVIASADTICAGTIISFSSMAINGGINPFYKWKVNGVNQPGSNSPIFSYLPVNGDVVSCEMTSSLECIIENPVFSNDVSIVVYPEVNAEIIVMASTNPFCTDQMVTFTTSAVNGGDNPAYQWFVNNLNTGINNPVFSYFPMQNDQVVCVMTSSMPCVLSNPVNSEIISMSQAPSPVVTFNQCVDLPVSQNKMPFKLKGGMPYGGFYAGPGVNSTTGVFSPGLVGTGNKNITYSYTNVYGCSSSQTNTILVIPNPPLTCGSIFTDPRDNHPYPTFPLPGGKCWMAANLNYGTLIQDNQPQSDNCSPEKYCLENMLSNCGIAGGFYQWDELMQYESGLGVQGLCPPGWHIPDSTEWRELIMQSSGNGMAGIDLKNLLTASGFHGVPYGLYYQNHTWWASDPLNMGSMFWTSTSVVNDLTRAVSRGIHHATPSVSRYNSLRSNALQVRCVRN